MKYIALDIGNVCIKIDKTTPLEKIGVINDRQMLEQFDYVMRLFEFGLMGEDEFFKTIAGIYDPANPDPAGAEKIFSSILVSPMPGMKELLNELPSSGITPVFFSDVSTYHLRKCTELLPEMKNFEGIFRFDHGAYKPSPKLFNAFEEKYGKPLLYTDDRADLIAAAINNNWNAVVFSSAEQLRRQITALSDK